MDSVYVVSMLPHGKFVWCSLVAVFSITLSAVVVPSGAVVTSAPIDAFVLTQAEAFSCSLNDIKFLVGVVVASLHHRMRFVRASSTSRPLQVLDAARGELDDT